MPAPVVVDGGGGCDCGVALAGVRQEMLREIRKVREEMMGALAWLLAERGLGTLWTGSDAVRIAQARLAIVPHRKYRRLYCAGER